MVWPTTTLVWGSQLVPYSEEHNSPTSPFSANVCVLTNVLSKYATDGLPMHRETLAAKGGSDTHFLSVTATFASLTCHRAVRCPAFHLHELIILLLGSLSKILRLGSCVYPKNVACNVSTPPILRQPKLGNDLNISHLYGWWRIWFWYLPPQIHDRSSKKESCR